MRIEWHDFKINGKKITARVSIKEKGDRKLIKDLYHDWKKPKTRFTKKELKKMNSKKGDKK